MRRDNGVAGPLPRLKQQVQMMIADGVKIAAGRRRRVDNIQSFSKRVCDHALRAMQYQHLFESILLTSDAYSPEKINLLNECFCQLMHSIIIKCRFVYQSP